MQKHRNKIDKVLRVWTAAISVLTAASEVQASSSTVDILRAFLIKHTHQVKP